MAETDAAEPRDLGPLLAAGAPGFAVVLVEPQLGENIGMVARAMGNCGLGDLRLVKPRDGWPNPSALAAASGADRIIQDARVFDSTADAVADLHAVLATTARPRDMTTDVLIPRTAAARLRAEVSAGGSAGVLFGKEAWGLSNDDVAHADAVITVPLNPQFSSLNLAQAVFVVAYEWFQAADQTPDSELVMPKDTRPANKEEMKGLFTHLEDELDACGFLRVKEKRPVMVRNIRNIFQRARLTEQEVRTLRGVVSGLAKFGGRFRE
jgi:tRNA/rRNA methyltransferase